MARYKPVDQSLRFVAVNPAAQILPGSFEHALTLLIDQDVALEAFEARFKNDEVGAPAYSPAVLLKIVLLAYSKGIVRSREIEALCKDNVLFNAISGDSQPHFTTIAKFVSSQAAPIADLFARVLVICNREGLIGRQMFAVDGVKLPSNASKAKSGRRAAGPRAPDPAADADPDVRALHRRGPRAVFSYLQTVPAVRNRVPEPVPPIAQALQPR